VLGFLAFLPRHAAAFGRHVFKKDKAWLAGLAERDVERSAACWAETLEDAWFEPCVTRLRRHQHAGDRVVLLSGTPQFVAAAIARALGVEEAIGALCATDGGRFRVAPPEVHPFAGEKVTLAREYARACGIELKDIVAYGDSIHDLPLFEVAGRAVAVRPDEQLASMAGMREWEIIGPVRRGPTSRLRGWLRSGVSGDLADRRTD
jgi:HAD superfamily phosphoserine phosphatase-like hydrolase